MKKLFMAVIALMMTLSTSAQFYIYFSDGTVAKVDSISMVAPEESDSPDNPTMPDEPNLSVGIGIFSVAEGKTVTFSKGNLQYHPANNVWRFAESQTDCIGNANSNISPTYDGWIDLLGWGTGANPTNSIIDYKSYQTFVDWGTNQIDADAPNTWRTLSRDEWMYIFYNRPNAQSLFALGSVNGVNGTIVLPDNWTTPAGVSFVVSTTKGLYWDGSGYYNHNGDNYSHNTYSSEQWVKMEKAGAVFFPATGFRWGTSVYGIGERGNYWSSTAGDETNAYDMIFELYGLYPQYLSHRNDGQAVRLVKDVEGDITEPEQPEEDEEQEVPSTNIVNGHEYVDLGLSVKWATCNVGASTPENYGCYFAWNMDIIYGDDWGGGPVVKPVSSKTAENTIERIVLDSLDDAAGIYWGEPWRTPTKLELDELVNNCSWEWILQNNTYGYKVTSKVEGYTENSIFIPTAGMVSENGKKLLDAETYGYYWSCTLHSDSYHFSGWIEYLNFSSTYVGTNFFYNVFGMPVRPVCE